MNHIKNASCSKSLYSSHRSCFLRFGSYLADNGIKYSAGTAHSWLELQQHLKSSKQTYAKALQRLDDVYTYGAIRFIHQMRMPLALELEEMVQAYLHGISDMYSVSHLANIETRCRYFLGFLQQQQGITTINGISYPDILAFCQDPLQSLCKADCCMYKSNIMKFLEWLSEKHLCPPGFAMLLFQGRWEKVLFIDEMPETAGKTISELKAKSYEDFPPDEFHLAAGEFCKELKQLGYAGTMLHTACYTLDQLYLFLDMNRLGYTPEVGWLWFESAAVFFGTNVGMSRRILSLFEGFTREGNVNAEKTFRYHPVLFDTIPKWCRQALTEFLRLKQKEEKSDSTVCMYRSANVRFCRFLAEQGITAFSGITPELLKKFNIEDRHRTPEGKNAYNVRIRNFIFYLAGQGLVDSPFLADALPCVSASKVKLVQTLSEEEIRKLEGYSDPDEPSLGLRDRAILRIGLKMGLRASDITALRLEQIDWMNVSIRFIQDKTDVEKILPMPVEVGNALYTYLSHGRPAGRSQYVFITHKAPYRKIGRSVCLRILKKALPERNVPGSGFHVTRKTFATELLKSGTGYLEVAGLLGHTGTDTVNKYLSLDEERMRLCPVSLKSAGISMKGGFRNA